MKRAAPFMTTLALLSLASLGGGMGPSPSHHHRPEPVPEPNYGKGEPSPPVVYNRSREKARRVRQMATRAASSS